MADASIDLVIAESERRYRLLFDNSSAGIAHCLMLYNGERPVDFTYLEVNPAFEAQTGLRGVTGKRVTEVIPGIRESSPRLFEIYGRVARSGGSERFEIFVEPLGQWFDVTAYGPQPDHFVTVFEVITERKRTEQNRVLFGQRLQQLTNVVQDLSQARSMEAIVEIVRSAARILAGSDGATFVLREGEYCHYVDEDAVAPHWKGRRFPISACISGWAMLNGQPAVVEDVYQDGRSSRDAYRTTLVRSLAMVPIRREAPIGAIGAYWANPHRATSEEVRVLQALADSASVSMENVRVLQEIEEGKARTRAIYDHLPNATFVWLRRDADWILTDFNEAARRVTKGTVVGTVGRPLHEFPHTLPNLRSDLDRCYEGRVAVRREAEYAVPSTEGPARLVLTYGFIPPEMVVLHVEDVTEQRRMEERFGLSQRLEAIGRLAGGVAHDFNNLLSVIINCATLAADTVREPDPLRADLLEIRNAGQRAAALTRQLLAFSRKQLLEPKVINLNKVVTGIESMLRRLLGEDIDIEVHLAEALGSVLADPGQMEQVIVNLAVNARDAMPQGGKLTIETDNVELDQDYANQHAAVTPGRHVLVSVTDTGTGMDAETRQHIFEPFFTTKSGGQGTGLGLATVYGIVKQSGGNIWVYSEPGRGTALKVYLPRVEGAPQEEKPNPVPIASTGTETVLLVEDDDAVRRLAERILRGAGYRVLCAASGAAALALYKDMDETIDLLLTDVVMPQMNGRELAQRLIATNSALKILYFSGYTENAIVHNGVLDPEANFIGKPFAAAELTRKVREVLDRG